MHLFKQIVISTGLMPEGKQGFVSLKRNGKHFTVEVPLHVLEQSKRTIIRGLCKEAIEVFDCDGNALVWFDIRGYRECPVAHGKFMVAVQRAYEFKALMDDELHVRALYDSLKENN